MAKTARSLSLAGLRPLALRSAQSHPNLKPSLHSRAASSNSACRMSGGIGLHPGPMSKRPAFSKMMDQPRLCMVQIVGGCCSGGNVTSGLSAFAGGVSVAFMLRAASRVKVMTVMPSGSAPRTSTRCLIRKARRVVLPLPGPATSATGPGKISAGSCSSLVPPTLSPTFGCRCLLRCGKCWQVNPFLPRPHEPAKLAAGHRTFYQLRCGM